LAQTQNNSGFCENLDSATQPSLLKDTSISVGAVSKDGSRNFFVNLPNANVRQVATLMVVRNGKTVKQIHSASLNGVGNWSTTSTYKLRSGDVLRVEIGGKKGRTLGL
jgi:hypothetical protein